MSKLIGFHICVVACSIVLLSSSPPCLASQKLEKRDMTKLQPGPWAGNGVEDEGTSLSNLKNILDPSEQTVSEEPSGVSKSSEMPLSEAFTAEREIQPVSPSHVFSSSWSLGVYTPAVAVTSTEEKELGPVKSEKELNENGELKAMLTTAVTTLNPSIEEESVSSPVSKTTAEDSAEVEHSFASLLATVMESRFATAEKAKSSWGFSTASELPSEQMPTLHPSTPNLEVTSDYPVIPTPQPPSVGSEAWTPRANMGSPLQMLTAPGYVAAKPPLASAEASLPLEAEMDGRQGELPVTASTVTIHPTVSVPPDWDDTKLGNISQGGNMQHEEMREGQVATKPSQTPQGDVGEEEDVTRVLPSPVSAPPTPVIAKESNCTALVSAQEEEMPVSFTGHDDVSLTVNLTGMDTSDLNSLENTDTVTAEERKSTALSLPETIAVVTDTKSDVLPTLGSSLEGVTQEMTTAPQEADDTPSVVMLAPVATQGTGVASLPWEESRKDTQMPAVPSATQMLTATDTSSTAKSPDVEDFTDVVPVTSEEAVPPPGGLSATQSGQTEEPSSGTVVLATPASMASSVRRTALPSVRKISTAVTYGLDRLESEEGEEEEEDEEEEEEEEEEDEEDKDIDSMDESMEGDTELPGFTLPGETSQEPLAGLENPAAQLAGVSYQVPDTIEWEQQNQGLVRSWMEKLKDKAGYMSGMLVPVGVGIAGALFILGALYSIKIMNRRRRNGSKRHKRKQREFNSMQDRVMLLADSSEDEF
ncbi:armadillo-like helical domain-containing protein 4 [Dromaius novaehollandiae]|uniref:armadillo-like helical domain-containing protein 4 n=1 Tax=Dromaius novaehollandiae TaxID=8790 RepID=UPI00311DBBD3